MDDAAPPRCPVCTGDTTPCGTKYSRFSGRTFRLRRCQSCGLAFVSDPRVDYDALYDEKYYRGQGADGLVDYLFEAEHQTSTIRRYEWQGILEVVSALTPIGAQTRWLDFGCGTGGLVSYLRDHGIAGAVGFEPGWGGRILGERGDLSVTTSDLDASRGTFDVVTLIEVIEHAVDPVSELERVRSLLRPGGLCFLTTGNAEPYRDRLADWRYVVPDVHVSYFEPRSLAVALDRAGFDPAFPGYQAGWDDIIRFKVLKSLHVRTANPLVGAVPWHLVARQIDRRLKVTAHPVGWARPWSSTPQ
jgi:SAM-dependent methyltransferase